jgi:hypothetical protein
MVTPKYNDVKGRHSVGAFHKLLQIKTQKGTQGSGQVFGRAGAPMLKGIGGVDLLYPTPTPESGYVR